jgi:multidrug efflux system outer membrane protein
MPASRPKPTASVARASFIVSACVNALVLFGCTVGPNYQRASAPVPAKWDTSAPWRESEPKDGLPKGEWWSIFQDDQLNELEKEALQQNQSIKIAVATLVQARATAALQVARLYPTASVTPSAERQRLAGNRPLNGSSVPLTPFSQGTYTLPFNINYEVDLFGRIRRSIEAAQANYQASAADTENVRLMVTSDVAADYFSLLQLDSELEILNNTVIALERGLELVNTRHKGGVASGLDVAEEETLLNMTRTQAVLLRQQRKQFEDALATLIGKPAPDFHLGNKPLKAEPPVFNAGLPSDLLERRPDIAAAERQMQVANAQIGIAKAAYYPSLSKSRLGRERRQLPASRAWRFSGRAGWHHGIDGADRGAANAAASGRFRPPHAGHFHEPLHRRARQLSGRCDCAAEFAFG